MEHLGEIISAASAVGVAFIGVQGVRTNKRNQEDKTRSERRAARRAEESRLAMEMQEACLSLAIATAIAVSEQRLNGEMEEGRRKASKAQDAYEAFITRLAAEQVAKI